MYENTYFCLKSDGKLRIKYLNWNQTNFYHIASFLLHGLRYFFNPELTYNKGSEGKTENQKKNYIKYKHVKENNKKRNYCSRCRKTFWRKVEFSGFIISPIAEKTEIHLVKSLFCNDLHQYSMPLFAQWVYDNR